MFWNLFFNLSGLRATGPSPWGCPASFCCLAWSWSAWQLCSDAQLYQTCPQTSSLLWPLSSAGPLQCWSGKNWHFPCPGQHDRENEDWRNTQHLWFCQETSRQACSHGSNFSKILVCLSHLWTLHLHPLPRLSTYLFMMLLRSSSCVDRQKFKLLI